MLPLVILRFTIWATFLAHHWPYPRQTHMTVSGQILRHLALLNLTFICDFRLATPAEAALPP